MSPINTNIFLAKTNVIVSMRVRVNAPKYHHVVYIFKRKLWTTQGNKDGMPSWRCLKCKIIMIFSLNPNVDRTISLQLRCKKEKNMNSIGHATKLTILHFLNILPPFINRSRLNWLIELSYRKKKSFYILNSGEPISRCITLILGNSGLTGYFFPVVA